MNSRPRARAAAAAVLGAVAVLLAAPAAAQQDRAPVALVVEVEGIITPVMADHIADGLRRARDEGDVLVILEMDTPGGLDASMRDIVKDLIDSPVPVAVFVVPGGRAASAGAIIAMAAHVAAMAPGTSIGAATPVDLQGGDVGRKVIEDAAAYSRSIARLRGRNEDFAEDAVRKGRAVPAAEAARIGVVDLIAAGRGALLEALDGREVAVAGDRTVTIDTTNVEVRVHELGFFRRILQWLADPNIAFLFLSIGSLAIIYELANPGIGGGGVVGALMIILALFALSVLPVSATGAILVALGIVLLVSELFVPGVGVLAAGGTASLILGGFFLFRGSVDIDLAVLIPVGAIVGGGTMIAGRLAWRVRRAPSPTGPGQVLDKVVVVRKWEGRTGQAFVEGAWWRLRAARGALREGQRARVVGVDGLDLLVEPEDRTEEGET